jgi:hypothetical protein
MDRCMDSFYASLLSWPDLTCDQLYSSTFTDDSFIRDMSMKSGMSMCEYARSMRRLHCLFTIEKKVLDEKLNAIDALPPPHRALRVGFEFLSKKFAAGANMSQLIWRSIVGLDPIIRVRCDCQLDSHFVSYAAKLDTNNKLPNS